VEASTLEGADGGSAECGDCVCGGVFPGGSG
jgi:hypothetical protein